VTLASAIEKIEWLFLAYFAAISAAYLGQNLIAVGSIRRYFRSLSLDDRDPAYSMLNLPISLVVPAYNESTSIVTSVRALLQLEYSDFELVVVNDGSTDDTLEKLIKAFQLYPYPEAYRQQVPCKPVKATYRSARFKNLRVVDKENGGSKADASNAGINLCRNPLVTIVDADGVLQRNALSRAVRPFLEDPSTVAAGGAIRIANGCKLREGFLEEVGLPRNFLALMQVLEYLRAFLFGRMGWEPLGAVLIVSGAFGVFKRTTLIEVGGYNPHAVGEDMELVVRIHRKMKQMRRRYRIAFIPDPVCWTDAPETIKDLGGQRARWQHGLGQALMLNKWLLMNPRGGTVSWLAIPFYVFFELLGPLIEAIGLVFFLTMGVLGVIAWPEAGIFLALSLSLGMVLSMSAIMLEEFSFAMYRKPGELARLYLAAVLENFGYRQMTVWWRLKGLYRWLSGGKHRWETITRSASVSASADDM
jgi:cellulose synthase/poly-beta-1,6-N-acetylglucosamine synthase-like glycosyltransferase